MKTFLNIIIIGEESDSINKTLKSIKGILELEIIKIIIITPSKINLKIKKYFPKKIFIFNDKGEGIYQAMNIGLNFSIYDLSYIWFLNSGDFAVSNSIKTKISLLKEFSKSNQEIIFFINKKHITIINMIYSSLKKFRIRDLNIIKILMIFLIFPASHQNILIKKYLHNEFETKYKYSSDFNLVAQLLFMNNKKVTIKEGSIAENSKGGLTDLNRFATIKERYFILLKILKIRNYNLLIVLLTINFISRILIMFMINLTKIIKDIFNKIL